MTRYGSLDLSIMKDKILTAVFVHEDETRVDLIVSSNEFYSIAHSQDCCETVYLDDVVGDWQDIMNSPILHFKEMPNEAGPQKYNIGTGYECEDDSFTWTFYEIATIKGSVTMKWYGSSNGYYSEKVGLYEGNAI